MYMYKCTCMCTLRERTSLTLPIHFYLETRTTFELGTPSISHCIFIFRLIVILGNMVDVASNSVEEEFL